MQRGEMFCKVTDIPKAAQTQDFARVHAAPSGESNFYPPNSCSSLLHIAQIHRFPQRSKWIARGHKLVRYVTLIVGCGDSAHHSIPLHFLRAVEFMPSGNAASVEMCKPLN